MIYKLAIDLDDTICETSKTLLEILTVDQLHPVVGLTDLQTPEIQSHVATLLNSTEFLSKLPEVKHAKHSLMSIVKKHQIGCYISSRLANHLNVTQSWLIDHQFPAAPLLLRSPEEFRPNWKIHWLLKNNLADRQTLIIDDSPDAFNNLPEQFGGKCMLFNRRQKEITDSKIISISSWPEIVEWLG